MNVLEVLGLAVAAYFVFVTLWLTKIEDYLQAGEPTPDGGDLDGE